VGSDEYLSLFIDFKTVNVAAWRLQQTGYDAPISLPIFVKLKRSSAYEDEKRALSAKIWR
jgi:hypothetical protein